MRNGQQRRMRGRVLKTQTLNWGHQTVNLCGGGVQKHALVHRLVMAAFVGPPPEGMQVCHNDGDPKNNRLGNLRYGTPSENMYDRGLHGTDHNALKSHCKYGHPLLLPNLTVATWEKRGWRCCLACNRARGYIKENPHLVGSFQALADRYLGEIMREVAAS